jgi:hypothetical protein
MNLPIAADSGQQVMEMSRFLEYPCGFSFSGLSTHERLKATLCIALSRVDAILLVIVLRRG